GYSIVNSAMPKVSPKAVLSASGAHGRVNHRRLPNFWILRRNQVMFAILRHRKFTRRTGIEVARAIWAGQFLLVDSPLQRHESVDKRFGPRRTAGNVHIDRNVAVDAFEDVVTLLEWSAGNRA